MVTEFDGRIVDQRLQHRLESVARIKRAVAVVDIIGQVAAGRPGEQYRGDVDPGVVNDLGEAIDRFLEAGVVAVNENEDPAPRRAPDPRVEIRSRLGEVHAIGAQDDEFAFRVAWRRRGQLHLSGLARAVRRDRHDDISEFESASPRAART